MAVIVCHVDRLRRTWRFEPSSIVAAHKRVYARRGIRELVFIMAAFGLSPAETGRLFHVRRQAVNAWMLEGVPLPRLAQVGRVAQAARALRGFFKPERLPAIVRDAMPALEQRSVLDTIATRGTEPVFELVQGLRSWTPSSESNRELRAQ
jgi:hypothetical protein